MDPWNVIKMYVCVFALHFNLEITLFLIPVYDNSPTRTPQGGLEMQILEENVFMSQCSFGLYCKVSFGSILLLCSTI
jgi:hypothetical protein